MKNRKLKNIKYSLFIIIYFVFGYSNLLLADIIENFDNLTQSSYGNYLYNGFEITNGLCNSTNAKSGKAIRLRDATTSLEFIGGDGNGKDGGVGVISFWYRAWDSSPTCVYDVKVNVNGGGWNIVGVQINSNSTIYNQWSYTLNETNDNIKIKIERVSGERLHIDDFIITDYSLIPDAPTNLTINFITYNKLHVTWDKPSGTHSADWAGVVVFARSNNTVDANVSNSDGIDWDDGNNEYGDGTLSSNSYCIANSAANANGSIEVSCSTWLSGGEDIYIVAYAYNEIAGNNNDDIWSEASNDTNKVLEVQGVSAISINSGNQRAELTWTNYSGLQGVWWDEVMVLCKAGSNVDATPTGDGSNFTADSTLGSGSEIGTGNFVVYKGVDTNKAIVGLTNGTAHFFRVFVRDEENWTDSDQYRSDSTTPNFLNTFLSDDFEDGNISGWVEGNSGDWIASSSVINGSYSLKHNLSNIESESYIYHSLNNLNINNGTTTWRFNVKNGNWDPSASNRFWAYLMANETNLSGNTVDGYVVGVNLSGSTDNLTLWKVTDGASGGAIVTSSFNWGNNEIIGIEVSRSVTGLWELKYDTNGGFDNLISADTGTNTDYNVSNYFGLFFDFTSTRAGLFWMDDLMVSQSGSAGTFAFWNGNSSSGWAVSTNWTNGSVPDSTIDVTIPNTPAGGNYLEINSGISAQVKDICLHSAGKLKINNGASLSVSGDLILKSDESTSASLVDLNYSGAVSFALNGQTKIEQYLTSNIWHYISSPISNASANVFYGIYLFEYDETKTNSGNIDENWTSISTQSTNLEVMKGYMVWNQNAPQTFYYQGTLNSGPINTIITNSGLGTGDGWNFVGNPYPSHIDWNLVNIPANIDNAIYYWDGIQYKSYVNNAGNGSRYIPPLQGFFIHCSANASLQFENNQRVHGTQPFYKQSGQNDYLVLKVEGNDYCDETFIRFDENGTENFDKKYDAFKWLGYFRAPQIYSKTDSAILSVNTLPTLLKNTTVRLGFEAGVSATYTLTASNLISFETTTSILLEDTYVSIIHDLRSCPYYSFYSDSAVSYDRFLLHFVNNPNKIIRRETDKIDIYSYGKSIYIISNKNFNGEIAIYNMIGQEIYKETLFNTNFKKIIMDKKQAYYIIKFLTNTSVITRKVFIQ